MCCRFRCDAGPAPLYSNRSLSVDSGRGSKLRARCTSYPWVQRTDDFRACARACVWMCVWFVIMVEETSWYELRNSASRGPNEGMHEEKGLHLRCSSFNRFALFGCLCVPSAILLPATMILRLYNIRTIRFVERCGEGEGCQGQDSRSEEITCLAGQGKRKSRTLSACFGLSHPNSDIFLSTTGWDSVSEYQGQGQGQSPPGALI